MNETAFVNITSGPDPLIINRTSPGVISFDISGYVDGNALGARLRGAYVTLELIKAGYDNTTKLDPNPTPSGTAADASFTLNYGVDDDTPQGNYTVVVRFTGTVNVNWGPYPHFFDLPIINASMAALNDLRVLASDVFVFNFWINDTTSDNFNQPVIDRNLYYELKAYLQGGADPLIGERVDFYDLTENKDLGYAITDANGNASLVLDANWTLCAGPHLIRATYDVTHINYSYYILNDDINVILNSGPVPTTVNKSGSADRLFYLQGSVNDTWGNGVPYGRITIKLFGPGMVDRSSYLLPQGGAEQVDNYYYTDSYGGFNASYYVHSSIPPGQHVLRIDFNGTFIYGAPYAHVYDLISFGNFSHSVNGFNNLTVNDPDQLSILIAYKGVHLSSTFTDANPPITVKRGQLVNISFNVTRSGSAPISGDQIIVRDVFADVNISTYVFTGLENGNFTLNIPTGGNHSGLHKWEFIFKNAAQIVFDTTNSTYILINETVTVGSSLSIPSIRRNFDTWTVSGTVSDSGQNLKGLEIMLYLFDASYQDKSNLLSVVGGRTKVINIDGSYSFSGTISINAPQGIYYFRVNTTSNIQSTDAPLAISINNAHTINSSSVDRQANITARTSIINEDYWNSYDPTYPEYTHMWINNSILFVNGTLEWDNGSAMVGYNLTIRVELLNGTTIATFVSNPTTGSGYFVGQYYIDESFPTYRADTRIFIDFYPYGNNDVDYVEADQQEVTI